MSERDFGNEQEMAVADKRHPALGPTEGAQDVSSLNRIVVPPGAYTDPNNPMANSNSVNLTVDKTPTPVSDDYGVTQLEEAGVEPHPVQIMLDDGSKLSGGTAGEPEPEQLPENRDEWSKANWQTQARTLGLAVSGNFDAVQSRVEEREAQIDAAKQMNAEDWKAQIEDADDLADLRALYTASGAEYSTVESAFDARQAELDQS